MGSSFGAAAEDSGKAIGVGLGSGAAGTGSVADGRRGLEHSVAGSVAVGDGTASLLGAENRQLTEPFASLRVRIVSVTGLVRAD